MWGPLDDVVMGGASQSKLQGTSWRGNVITEGGGFAGIRSQPIKPALDAYDLKNVVMMTVCPSNLASLKFILRLTFDPKPLGVPTNHEFNGLFHSEGQCRTSHNAPA